MGKRNLWLTFGVRVNRLIYKSVEEDSPSPRKDDTDELVDKKKEQILFSSYGNVAKVTGEKKNLEYVSEVRMTRILYYFVHVGKPDSNHSHYPIFCLI